MRPTFPRAAAWLLLVTLLLTPLVTAAPAPAQDAEKTVDVPITRAVLFSSGVGYFEHTGQITDSAVMRLLFKTDQINDVLKSMVLMDVDGGTIGSVNYTSNDPIDRALRSFGVDISGDPTLAELLQQLRGAEVRISFSAGESVTGNLLSIETRKKVVGDPPATIEEHIIVLVTAQGIRSVPLSQIDRLELSDKNLQQELNKALALLVSSRDTDRKPVDIRFVGQGKRNVRVGYLVETPVWKTSYRLDLSGEKPLMQGWAIVENTSDTDWNNLTLSLVSGRPISFVQDLYTPLYLPRPVVTPPMYASLQPRVYDEGIELAKKAEKLDALSLRRGRQLSAPQAAARPAAPGNANRAFAGRGAAAYDGKAGGDISLQQGVQSIASAASVGELFQFTIQQPVSLPRRRSAMLPIINKAIAAEKVSIYNAAVLAKHPLNGVQLTNDTGLKMMAGPVTVFDAGSYAGDAQIDHLAPGDKRLLSYAVDLNVTVDPSQNSSSRITTAKIVRGVLEVRRLNTYTQTYLIKNKAAAKRTMIIEHPFVNGRTLIEPEKPEEKTPTVYRFKVPVDADSTGKFIVAEQQTSSQSIALLTQPTNSFAYYASNGEIPPAVRDALAKAVQLKNQLTVLQQKHAQLAKQLNDIKQGQQRLRDNIKTVGNDSVLGKRYLSKLGDEEDEIESLERQIEATQKQVDAKQNELADYLNGLDVGA